MVNCGERHIAPGGDTTRLVVSVTELTCKSCKKTYEPNKREISTKNPNIYYKTCFECRQKKAEYMRHYMREYVRRKF
jgi:hypothetical protein